MGGRLMQRDLAWVESVLGSGGMLLGSGLSGRGGDAWLGACIDTREECAGRIFFALRGGKTDGHRFAREAFEKGCRACVVDDDGAARELSAAGAPWFRVRGALEALQELARAYRGTLALRVVAVTGSMGKTTTKEYIRAVLKKKYRVQSNPGNLNNHIGVPLTVLDTDQDSEYLVCEIAANHAGEIEFLSRLLRPDVGVITNIGDAHIGHFGSREKIARAKSEIFAGIDPEGHALLPADDDFIGVLRESARCRVITFGLADDSTYRISGVSGNAEGIRFAVNAVPVEIRGIGSYNVPNATAAYAVGELCGVEIDSIRAALSEAEPMARRAKMYKGRGIVLVDDSYNANPTSMRAALDSFVRLDAKRRIAVLGDMAELGEFSDAAHRDLGAYLADCPVDAVYWYGENGRIVSGALRSGKIKFEWHRNVEELVRVLGEEIRAGDSVLVKASRACYLDRVVDALLDAVLRQARD
jgi:UDP-N-acetylmuramoyl-tripeptide--D-alanyl-D-alanine ligase